MKRCMGLGFGEEVRCVECILVECRQRPVIEALRGQIALVTLQHFEGRRKRRLTHGRLMRRRNGCQLTNTAFSGDRDGFEIEAGGSEYVVRQTVLLDNVWEHVHVLLMVDPIIRRLRVDRG